MKNVKRGNIQDSFDRCVADKIRGYPRPKTYPIHFEWDNTSGCVITNRCWNKPFWYGDGTPATEPSVIVRRSDFDALVKLAKRAQP